MTGKMKLLIDGMHCDACVRRVRAALDNQPGVSVDDVKVGEATVEVIEPASEATLRETIAEQGFTLKEVK